MIERRKQNLDPIDVYSIETWELLKLCGAVRHTDLQDASPDAAPRSIPERRVEERRRQTGTTDGRGED